jgi:hypothetical protein
MPPETTILKVNNAPAAALVHHFGTCVFVVLESIQYSNPTYWSESYREPPRSTIGIAAVLTASSTSTVSLSTASLSTSTTKSDARHDHQLGCVRFVFGADFAHPDAVAFGVVLGLAH